MVKSRNKSSPSSNNSRRTRTTTTTTINVNNEVSLLTEENSYMQDYGKIKYFYIEPKKFN